MCQIYFHELNQIMFNPITIQFVFVVNEQCFKLWVSWVTFNNFSPALILIICGIWWGLTASISGCIETLSYGSIIAAFKPVFTCTLFEGSRTTLPDLSWDVLIIMRALNENRSQSLVYYLFNIKQGFMWSLSICTLCF